MDRTKSLAEYQRALERFETCNDTFILPGLHMVLRLDCRRHGTWDPGEYARYPFGQKTIGSLVATARQMMCFGPRVTLAYVHGDEINLYFDPSDSQTLRRRHKFVSLLSSFASYSFLQLSGAGALFYARLSELPHPDLVVDFFVWQRRCAQRNRLVRAIRDQLKAQGLSEQDIDAKLHGVPEEQRRQLAAELGYDLGSVLAHERLGTFLWWGERSESTKRYQHIGYSDTPENEEQFEHFLRGRIGGPSYLPETPVEEIDLLDFTAPGRPPVGGKRDEPYRAPHRSGALRLKR